jgi:hypothetical protein
MVAFRGHSSVVRISGGHSLELLPYFFGFSALLLSSPLCSPFIDCLGVDSRGCNKDA